MSVETRFHSNEAFGLEKPEFDCGRYTMAFSDQPGGFEVNTDKSLPRRDGMTPLPLTKDQGQLLSTAIQNQFGYTTADQAKIALDAYRKNPNETTKKEFEAKQKQYYDNKSIVTGIHNVRRDKSNPNTIILDTRPVNFPFSINFSKAESSDQLTEMASCASTTLILETSDGMGILQHRSEEAGSWPGTPSATASGYIDEIPFEKEEIPKQFMNEGVKTRYLTRRLKKLTTKEVKENALRELDEEIGLDPKDIFDVRIGAMVHEPKTVHDEFILSGKTKLTGDQVVEKSADAARTKKLRPGEFREKFVLFEINPENIEKLVTKVKCPIPNSHNSAFVNKGYEQMLKKGSKQQADAWRDKISKGVDQNYVEIDDIVKKYTKTLKDKFEKDIKDKNPKATKEEIEVEVNRLMIPQRQYDLVEAKIKQFKELHPTATNEQLEAERKKQMNLLPKRNPNGYSPDFLPEEQGLKGFFKALDEAKFKYRVSKQK
ncbi:MAG: hypothetical protein Q7T54_01740 [Candidatus Levybacteria bacterium]|nr:hypothetical protein [Candidatus Levybacteria bacterium]